MLLPQKWCQHFVKIICNKGSRCVVRSLKEKNPNIANLSDVGLMNNNNNNDGVSLSLAQIVV